MRASIALFSCIGLALSCASTPAPPNADAAPAASSAASPPPSAAPTPPVQASVKDLGDKLALEEGQVRFRGMVVPTKGGFLVRGVVLDDSELSKALASEKPADAKSADWLLGAVVEIEAELQKVTQPAPSPSEPVEQMRSGDFFRAKKIASAKLVAKAVVIEGELSRSKGLFALGDRLIDHHDLDWALAGSGGARSGDRVRIYGQPRTFVCEPGTQCLIDGSLPLFDVGRAEKLK